MEKAKRRSLFLGLAVLASLASCSDGDGDKKVVLPELELTAEEMAVATTVNNSEIDMFRDFAKTIKVTEEDLAMRSPNLGFSPLSATMAVSMLANAVGDEDAAKLSEILGVDNLSALNAYNTKLLNYLPYQEEGNVLKLANAMWYQSGRPIDASFSKTVGEVFGSVPSPLDFAGNPEGAINAINRWVSNNTEGMIDDFAHSASCNYEMSLFLANALYYEGLWDRPFEKKNTSDKPFYNGTENLSVPTMNREGGYYYYENKGVEMVSLPFKGFRQELLVILPPEGTDVREFSCGFGSAEFDELLSTGRPMKLDLYMPKFKINKLVDISPYLASKGVESQMLNLVKANLGCYNTLIQQKNVFEVDEDGAKLASVTGNGYVSSPGIDGVYRIDRPFVYILRDVSGSVLIAGWIYDPLK